MGKKLPACRAKLILQNKKATLRRLVLCGVVWAVGVSSIKGSGNVEGIQQVAVGERGGSQTLRHSVTL